MRHASYVKNGDLTKRLPIQVFCRVLFTLPNVDFDKLERDLLFVKNDRYTSRAAGVGEAIECQDHLC